ncbi:MAG: GxxExxY protein [Betaproteobacteria bacterium]|nr:GxxExxY protein [Rhodocyclales bacterium]
MTALATATRRHGEALDCPDELALKVVDQLQPVHIAQIMTYLKLSNIRRGYLLNFNVKLLKEGIKRVSL